MFMRIKFGYDHIILLLEIKARCIQTIRPYSNVGVFTFVHFYFIILEYKFNSCTLTFFTLSTFILFPSDSLIHMYIMYIYFII